MKVSELKLFETDDHDLDDDFDFETEEDTSNLNLSDSNLTEIPSWVKDTYFGNVNLSSNKLTSLSGYPTDIGGSFTIQDNEFINFIGFPKKVGNNVYCSRSNSSMDFANMPMTEIKGDFSFGTKTNSQFRDCKNFSQLFKSLSKVRLVLLPNDEKFEDMFGELMLKKKAGEDLDELLVEGMNWCTDHGYPGDFWGDI